jgi:hypothetical protein
MQKNNYKTLRGIKMLKSEFNLIVMIILFLAGLTNFYPSEISFYDQYIIPIIEQNNTSENVFYPHISILIDIFRILIIIATFIDLIALLKYAVRYDVFGFRQILTK